MSRRTRGVSGTVSSGGMRTPSLVESRAASSGSMQSDMGRPHECQTGGMPMSHRNSTVNMA